MLEAAGGGGGSWFGMATGVGELQGAVHSGDLYMDQDGANRLKKAMKDMQDTLNEVMQESGVLSQEPPIGDTPKCRVYKPFLPTVATDKDQGLFPQVQKMHDQAQDIIENIDSCVRDMGETESDATWNLDSTTDD